MMEFIARFLQQFATTHTTNSEEAYGIAWPRGPHHFRLGMSRIFIGWIWRRLE
jgi:hypothetical protein